MPTFSPKLIFWLTFCSMIGSGIAGGTIHLSGMVPSDWIPPVTAWVSTITFCVLAFLSLATGYAGSGRGPLAGPPSLTEAHQVMDDAKAATQGKQS